MIRKLDSTSLLINYDILAGKTSKGTSTCHYIHADRTLELLVRLKNSKYFKGKRKIKFENDYNDIDRAIKDYEGRINECSYRR